jgi:hypothetical protein
MSTKKKPTTVTTADEFKVFLRMAKAGDYAIYHQGNLAGDKSLEFSNLPGDQRIVLQALAVEVCLAHERGEVFMIQDRSPDLMEAIYLVQRSSARLELSLPAEDDLVV